MRYLVIIPARGGSKRLPGKNIKHFCNKPLIAHSIQYAINNDLQVIVTSDDDEINTISNQYGAQTIQRPKEIAGDFATTTSALIHVLESLPKEELPDAIITLQATNPLREKNLLKKCIEEFEKNSEEIDSLITVSENHHKLGEIIENKFVPSLYKQEQRSQDLKKYYFENGLIYITKTSTLEQKNSIFGDVIFPYITNNKFDTVDIDTLEDFEIGELLYTHYKQKFY